MLEDTVKNYSDCGVQAGSSRVYLALHSPTPNTTPPLVCNGYNDILKTPGVKLLGSPLTQSIELDESPSKPPMPRKAKQSQLPLQRPAHSYMRTQRIATMPEHGPIDLTKLASARVVSMPQRIRPVAAFPPSPVTKLVDYSSDFSRLSITPDRGPRARVISHGSEWPNTPSPPSSPESVMIISTNVQLPQSFLRRQSPKLNVPHIDKEGETSEAVAQSRSSYENLA
jgi:hypothetical protein